MLPHPLISSRTHSFNKSTCLCKTSAAAARGKHCGTQPERLHWDELGLLLHTVTAMGNEEFSTFFPTPFAETSILLKVLKSLGHRPPYAITAKPLKLWMTL